MIIKEKLGTLSSFAMNGRTIDRLPLEWYECNKRILHKRTELGRELMLKFLNSAPNLQQDDVLLADEQILVVVEVLPCETIVLRPSTMHQMAYACYEIGNRHLPLFMEGDALLLPHEAPVFRLLQAAGFAPQVEKRKLLNPLRTTVTPHQHAGEGKESLFSKILKLTAPSNE
jgi:urease accessory protein